MIIYRALNCSQIEDAKRGASIYPKDIMSRYTLQEHVERERGGVRTAFISCTRSLNVIKKYSTLRGPSGTTSPSVIIKINTDRMPPGVVFDISRGIDPERRGVSLCMTARTHAIRDQEVLIKGSIPREAYEIMEDYDAYKSDIPSSPSTSQTVSTSKPRSQTR